MDDVWDFLEVEVKVFPRGRYRRLVELAEQACPPGARMLRKPHVAFFDLYLDTPELALAHNDAYLRLRFSKTAFRRKGKYKLFFKENAPAAPGAQYLSRREVRTDLTLDEVRLHRTGDLPGKSAELAYGILDRVAAGRATQAICLVSSFRRYFTMRGNDPKLPDFLNLSIEHSTAFAARDIDIDMLLETGFVDAIPGAKTYDFEISEAELTIEGVPAANEMFQKLVKSLADEFGISLDTKYWACLRELGIADPRPVARPV